MYTHEPFRVFIFEFAAIDDLMLLYVQQDRVEEAFKLEQLARRLLLTELVTDHRVRFESPEVREKLAAVKTSTASSTSEDVLRTLASSHPRMAKILRTSNARDLVETMPEDAAMIVYRLSSDGLVVFVLDSEGVTAKTLDVSSQQLREKIAE